MGAIKFLRVMSVRSKDPGVLVTIGEQFVRWNPKRGWDCTCLTLDDEYDCGHIMTIEGMLDARVTTPEERQNND